MQLMGSIMRGLQPSVRPCTVRRGHCDAAAFLRARRGLSSGRPQPVFSVAVQQAATQETVAARAAAPTPIPVRFTLRREVGFGQRHVVVGSDPALGAWDAGDAAMMTWGEGHVWTAEVPLPPGAAVEFKCVRVVDGQEGGQEWEGGENHVLSIPGSGVASIAVEVAWGGQLDIQSQEAVAAAGVAATAAEAAPTAEPAAAQQEQVGLAPTADPTVAVAAKDEAAASAAPAAAVAGQKAVDPAYAPPMATAPLASEERGGGEPETVSMAVRTASLLVVLSAGLMVYSCNLTPNVCRAAMGPPPHWQELGSLAAQGMEHLGELGAKGLASLRGQVSGLTSFGELGAKTAESLVELGTKGLDSLRGQGLELDNLGKLAAKSLDSLRSQGSELADAAATNLEDIAAKAQSLQL